MQPPPQSLGHQPMSYPSGKGQYRCRGLCEQELGHSVTTSVPTGLGTVVSPVRHLLRMLNEEADAASRELNMCTE